MTEPLRVLAVVAHPDDEMQLSGTIALQAQAGMEVTIAVACNGNMGGLAGATPEERAQVRLLEMRESCQVLGAVVEWMDYGDIDFMHDYHEHYQETESNFRDMVRRVDPHLMIIPALDDYHQHHRAAAELALNASINAANPAIPGNEEPASGVPWALHMPPMVPGAFIPGVYVDITETFDLKLEALRAHQSQLKYLKKHHRTDIFKQVEAMARMHGAACGVTYAEVFSHCLTFNRPAPIQQLARFFPGGTRGG